MSNDCLADPPGVGLKDECCHRLFEGRYSLILKSSLLVSGEAAVQASVQRIRNSSGNCVRYFTPQPSRYGKKQDLGHKFQHGPASQVERSGRFDRIPWDSQHGAQTRLRAGPDAPTIKEATGFMREASTPSIAVAAVI